VPFHNKLNLSIKGETKNAMFQLHSITGQLLLEKKNLKNETILISTEHFSPGTYVLTVFDQGQIIERFKLLRQ